MWGTIFGRGILTWEGLPSRGAGHAAEGRPRGSDHALGEWHPRVGKVIEVLDPSRPPVGLPGSHSWAPSALHN